MIGVRGDAAVSRTRWEAAHAVMDVDQVVGNGALLGGRKAGVDVAEIIPCGLLKEHDRPGQCRSRQVHGEHAGHGNAHPGELRPPVRESREAFGAVLSRDPDNHSLAGRQLHREHEVTSAHRDSARGHGLLMEASSDRPQDCPAGSEVFMAGAVPLPREG